jgi:hypothetical protein
VGVFGTRQPGAIAVVEAPVSLAYAQKARVTFFAVSISVALAVSTVAVVFARSLPATVVGVLVAILSGLVCGFVAALVVRVWPVLRVLWWWSLEITLTGLAVLVPTMLARVTYPWLALLLVAVVAAVLGLVPRVRRFLRTWFWCVADRHRLRLCFAQIIRSGNRSKAGYLPLMLWARPTPAGERVWLWLRPGLDLVDLDGKTGQLAVACGAKEVRVVNESPRYAALIRVDVARRDPLVNEVLSPLAGLVPVRDGDEAGVPVSPGMPPVGLDLADIPEPRTEPESRGGRR